jgi:putative transcriptional regulator
MSDSAVPQFLREALEEESPQDASELLRAHALIERSLPSSGAHAPPNPATLKRLLDRVAVLPDKYAPFFDQLITMFDVDEATLRRDLARAADARNWKPSGLPGVRIIPMTGGSGVAGAETAIVRFAAGMRFPRHSHRGDEVTLILEGGYVDEAGKEYHPGDMDPRSITDGAHAFHTFKTEPCIAATTNRGFEFHAWPLRILQRLAGR